MPYFNVLNKGLFLEDYFFFAVKIQEIKNLFLSKFFIKKDVEILESRVPKLALRMKLLKSKFDFSINECAIEWRFLIAYDIKKANTI